MFFAVGKGSVFETWLPPNDEETRSSLIPEAVKKAGEQGETYYQYIKTGEVNDLFGKRPKYEKVLIKENAKHDVYPYHLQKIKVKGKTYRFSHTLAASVWVENGLYQIALPELQLSASHPDRAGAEKDFDTALARLIGLLEKENSSNADVKTKSALFRLKDLLVED